MLLPPLANSIFMFFFTFFITFIVAFVNDKFIEPKLNDFLPEEEIEENFSTSLSLKKIKGLKYAAIGFVVSFAVIALLSIPSWGPLRNPNTGLLLLGWSPLLSAIVPVICFIFLFQDYFMGLRLVK